MTDSGAVGLTDEAIRVKAPASVTRRACFRQLVGAWAIEDTALSGYVEQLRGMDMETVWAENRKLGDYPIYSPAAFSIIEDLQASGHEVEASVLLGDDEDERRGPPPYVRVGSTAVIPVSGPLSKHPSSLSHRFGGSSTAGMRQALQMALGDKKVERVMFHIDSPGGTVAGTGDLGDDIARANAVKPTAAFVEDLGASAALWIASQTGHIYASRHAEVGSIGVIQVVHDTSKMAEKAGIEVHVIKSGPYKGGPVPGTKVTDAQKKEMQSTISTIHDQFVRTVAEGRGLSVESIAAIADGRVFQAPRAKELGLVDTISTFSGALSHFAGLSASDVQRRTAPPPPEVSSTGGRNAKVPNNPSNSGEPVDGEWTAPTLADVAAYVGLPRDTLWADFTDAQKTRASRLYADAAESWTDDFDADLNLPHHFYSGENAGRVSRRGTIAAKARLNQVGNLHSSADDVRAHLNAHVSDEDDDDDEMDSSAEATGAGPRTPDKDYVEANRQPLNTAQSLASTRSHMADSPPDTQDAAPQSTEAGAENDLAAMQQRLAAVESRFENLDRATKEAEQKRVTSLRATLKEEFNVSDERLAKFETSAALEALLEEKREDARVKDAGGRGREAGAGLPAGRESQVEVFYKELEDEDKKWQAEMANWGVTA